MSRGLTIADFVQQVLYAMYKVRLDVKLSTDTGANNSAIYHSKSDKFKEIVMEGNFMLQEFQKEQDWQFLRERWEVGITRSTRHHIQEFQIPEDAYKICTGYNDAVRLHLPGNPVACMEIPIDPVRSGNAHVIDMHDEYGRANVSNIEQRAFVVGDTLTFYRPWLPNECGLLIETDVIRYIEPMHICDSNCPDNCPKAYDDVLFKWMPDPYYFIVRTAARRALADPSCAEIAQSLTDEATKFLSSVRSNSAAHTNTDTYETSTLGYISVL